MYPYLISETLNNHKTIITGLVEDTNSLKEFEPIDLLESDFIFWGADNQPYVLRAVDPSRHEALIASQNLQNVQEVKFVPQHSVSQNLRDILESTLLSKGAKSKQYHKSELSTKSLDELKVLVLSQIT